MANGPRQKRLRKADIVRESTGQKKTGRGGARKGAGRPKGGTNVNTTEFFEKFDTLCEKYGDPLETLFVIQASKKVKPETRVRAAEHLSSYRHHKLKAIELNMNADKPIVLIDGTDAKL